MTAVLATIGLALSAVFRTVPAGENTREESLAATRSALVEPADLQRREHLFTAVALSAVVIGVVVFAFGGSFLAMASDALGFVPWGSEHVWNLTTGPFGFLCGVGAAAGLRARMVHRALNRWTNAGRPEGWRTPRSARPGNRDLVYWLVCGVLLGWLMWASSDILRTDRDVWVAPAAAEVAREWWVDHSVPDRQ